MVRELEQDKAEARRRSLEQAAAEEEGRQRGLVQRTSQGTVRSLSCFGQAVLLCDTAVEGWPVLYCNEAWLQLTGGDGGGGAWLTGWPASWPPGRLAAVLLALPLRVVSLLPEGWQKPHRLAYSSSSRSCGLAPPPPSMCCAAGVEEMSCMHSGFQQLFPAADVSSAFQAA